MKKWLARLLLLIKTMVGKIVDVDEKMVGKIVIVNEKWLARLLLLIKKMVGKIVDVDEKMFDKILLLKGDLRSLPRTCAPLFSF